MKYRSYIDGMRALAVLPVILFHSQEDSFAAGYLGVDIFFVLSGFLISQQIFSGYDQNNFSFLEFVKRRARRILPALFFVILISSIFSVLLLRPEDLISFSTSVISAKLFISNIYFWRQTGYFDTLSNLKPLLHTWSLSVEGQFYLGFPLVILLAGAWLRNIPRIVILWILFIGSFGFFVVCSQIWPSASFYFGPTRFWELLAGALAAQYTNQGNIRPFQNLSSLAFILICLCYYAGSQGFIEDRFVLTSAVVIATAVIVVFTRPGSWVHSLLANKILVVVGLISYSLYLWHQPVFAFLRHYYGSTIPAFSWWIALSTVFLLSFATWLFIEKPFRSSRTSFRNTFKFLSAVATLNVVLCLAVFASDGFPYRFGEMSGFFGTPPKSPVRSQCHTDGIEFLRAEESCTYFLDDAAIAVYGDSHAVELAWSVAKIARTKGFGVRHMSFSGCSPYPVEGKTPGCSNWNDHTVSYLVSTKQIDVVIMSHRMAKHVRGDHLSSASVLDQVSAKHGDKVLRQYEDTILTLVKAGKRVVIVKQAPELQRTFSEVLSSYLRFGYSRDLVISTDIKSWQARYEKIDKVLRNLPSQVIVVDPADILCEHDVCSSVIGGLPAYYDTHHMSLIGTDAVAKKIFEVLEKQQQTGDNP
ncbi:MAG: acyltransferase family protein [Paracoccaceae bacterium]